jgi:UDP-GlcNAc3NAcA epimerase
MMAERHVALIATDSGGMQKEAYFHGVPCVTLRDETEWTELVDLGWHRSASSTRTDIACEIRAAVGTTGGEGRPYGDGNVAEHIARAHW